MKQDAGCFQSASAAFVTKFGQLTNVALRSQQKASAMLQSSLFTLATMLAALTIGYRASALGHTVNLQHRLYGDTIG